MEPGFFGWHDLACDDVARAAHFYAAVFGWRARTASANGGAFDVLSAGGRDMASLYRIGSAARARGMRAHWTAYVAVASADAAAARAVAAGGKVLVQPFDIVETNAARIARIAIVADPEGAAFGLWEGSGDVPTIASTLSR